jgi:monofunctional biosynthetic peptidoglycan transglycosylase
MQNMVHRGSRSQHQTARWRPWVRGLGLVLVASACLYEGWILVRIIGLRTTNPTQTALMEHRQEEARKQGRSLRRVHVWVPYERISPHLVRAVLAGEDSRFFDHAGFDWEEIQKAIKRDWQERGFVRGASTITQQVAKNLFLSPSRTPWRKLQEALITVELELLLSKRRILEIYLNVIEWGDGLYGAEAAAQHYFRTSAEALTIEQAAFLAAIIPGPLGAYHPQRHRARVARRAALIERLMRHVVIPPEMR